MNESFQILVYFVRELFYTISTAKISITVWYDLKMLSVFKKRDFGFMESLPFCFKALFFFYSWNSSHFNQDTEVGAAAGTVVTAESNYSSFCNSHPSNTGVAVRGGQNFQTIPVVMLFWLLLLLPREVKPIHGLQNETLNFRGWHLTLTLSDSWKGVGQARISALHTQFSFFPVNLTTSFLTRNF